MNTSYSSSVQPPPYVLQVHLFYSCFLLVQSLKDDLSLWGLAGVAGQNSLLSCATSLFPSCAPWSGWAEWSFRAVYLKVVLSLMCSVCSTIPLPSWNTSNVQGTEETSRTVQTETNTSAVKAHIFSDKAINNQSKHLWMLWRMTVLCYCPCRHGPWAAKTAFWIVRYFSCCGKCSVSPFMWGLEVFL